MDDDRDLRKNAKHLESLSGFLKKAMDLSDQLLGQLQNSDYKIMEKFRPFMGSQKNIEELFSFYERYEKATEKFEKIRDGFGLDEKTTHSLEDLDRSDVLGTMEELGEFQQSFKNYKEVKIVGAFLESVAEMQNRIRKLIRRSILGALEMLPKIPDGVRKYVRFILKDGNDKEFLAAYTKKVYQKLGFTVIKDNLEPILQQTDNLTAYFSLIVDINKSILGRRAAHNITVGLITLLVINLKKIIADALGLIDKDNKPEYIPFLIQLSANLKHSEGIKIKEIEELFVYKKHINTLILNCFIQLFGDLELMEDARHDFQAETPCATMRAVLARFRDCKGVRNSWVDSHGPSFGVYKPHDLNENFSEKCLAKVCELARRLSGTERSIYLINNIHAFREFISSVDGKELKEQISKHVKIITGLWRIKLEGVAENHIFDFLMDELEASQGYKLPEEVQAAVSKELKTIIAGMVDSKMIHGNILAINSRIDKSYTGNSD